MWFFEFRHKSSNVNFYIEAKSLREAWQMVWRMFDADKYEVEYIGRYKVNID